MSEIVDAKDFKIQNLERILRDRDQEIASLRKRLETARYYTIAARDRIVQAIDGDIDRPILRSLE